MNKHTIGAFPFAAVLFLAACAQDDVSDTESTDIAVASQPASMSKVKLAPPISTVKPGASVTFTHDAVKPLEVGENGSVTITVHEGYPFGTLSLEATGGSELDVFGAERQIQVDMADATSHTWRLDFQPQSDGVHYISIQATARPEAGVFETRAFAVRVNAGDWQSAKATSGLTKQMLDDDTPAVMLEAREFIE